MWEATDLSDFTDCGHWFFTELMCRPSVNKVDYCFYYHTLWSLSLFSNMQSLENRRYFQALVLLFKCIKNNGPSYISNLLEQRTLHYNLRNGDCNLVQLSYHNRYCHNSFTYKLTHLWNQLPVYIKQSSNLNDFHKKLETYNFYNLKDIRYFFTGVMGAYRQVLIHAYEYVYTYCILIFFTF